MTSRKDQKSKTKQTLSVVTSAFINDSAFIKRYLSRFLSSQHDIEDVAQEAYLRAFVAEKKKDGDIEHPRAFLFRIAKNLAISRLRKKSYQITDYIEDLGVSVVIQDGTDPERELEAQQSLGLYCEAVASLPEKTRQIFLLRKMHGLKHKEIAKRMSLSVSSVEKHLQKARAGTSAFLRERKENDEASLISHNTGAKSGRDITPIGGT
ncbi:MAG: RNA polymerase subunit sigma-70 [Robiginitomaculum sp.]|nr:MAG: RNA polymerase subunit sigma-70 [Robiginitomaculum sp.]